MPKRFDSITIDEFHIEEIPSSSSWVIIAPPTTGKSTLIENLAFFNKNKFPVAKVFMGNEDGYNHFCKIFGKLFVMNYYDEDEHRRFCHRQGELIRLGHPHPGCICILDDVGDDRKIFRKVPMSASYKKGSQHWGQLFLLATQEAFDVPPIIRSSTMYVALGRNNDEEQRKKLYHAFGGVCGNYNRFCDLMDQICEEYTFMIIKKHAKTNRLEDCVFWYKTKVLSPWRFGCHEYRDWGKSRYNPQYREELLMT
jgi:hypothetical protein